MLLVARGIQVVNRKKNTRDVDSRDIDIAEWLAIAAICGVSVHLVACDDGSDNCMCN